MLGPFNQDRERAIASAQIDLAMVIAAEDDIKDSIPIQVT